MFPSALPPVELSDLSITEPVFLGPEARGGRRRLDRRDHRTGDQRRRAVGPYKKDGRWSARAGGMGRAP